MQLRDRIPEFRDAIRRAAAENGAHDVRVFGSVARGEERDRDAIRYQIIVPGEARVCSSSP